MPGSAVKQLIKRAALPASGPHRLLGGPARGTRMMVDFERNTRIYLGLYEVELNRFLRSMLKPGTTTFDVGAQLGYHTLMFARATGSQVASFDCDPACLAVLRHNLELNPQLRARVQVLGTAVGDGPGQTPLDELAFSPAGFIPDLVKIDVDGGELGVLRSGRRLLAERRPQLIVETHSRELERACGELLCAHGYRPVVVNQRRLAPDRRITELNRWLLCR